MHAGAPARDLWLGIGVGRWFLLLLSEGKEQLGEGRELLLTTPLVSNLIVPTVKRHGSVHPAVSMQTE